MTLNGTRLWSLRCKLITMLVLGVCSSSVHAEQDVTSLAGDSSGVGTQAYDAVVLDQVSACLDRAKLPREVAATRVVARFSLARDGTPYPDSIFTLMEGPDAEAERLAGHAAREAILTCGAKGFDLPDEAYRLWKDVNVTFTPDPWPPHWMKAPPRPTQRGTSGVSTGGGPVAGSVLPEPATASSVTPVMTADEIANIKDQVARCWNSGALSEEGQATSVTIRFQLSFGGEILPETVELVDAEGPGVQEAFTAARRAVVRCVQRLEVPGDPLLYDAWRTMELTFAAVAN